MAGNRAVAGPVQQDVPQPTPADKIEGLPTTGLFGKSPAMTISVVMFLVNFLVREAVRRGYVPPVTPEIQGFADRFGREAAETAITILSGLPFIIQGYWTKLKVFSPRSVWKRYFAPAEAARRAAP